MKNKLGLNFAMEIIILVAWGVWMVRNNKIFNNHTPSFDKWMFLYIQELKLLNYKIKRNILIPSKNGYTLADDGQPPFRCHGGQATRRLGSPSASNSR
jgi:hypothetical protein